MENKRHLYSYSVFTNQHEIKLSHTLHKHFQHSGPIHSFKKHSSYLRSEVATAAENTNIMVFSHTTPCNLVEDDQHFDGSCCLHLQCKQCHLEDIGNMFSRYYGTSYQTALSHIANDSNYDISSTETFCFSSNTIETLI